MHEFMRAGWRRRREEGGEVGHKKNLQELNER